MGVKLENMQVVIAEQRGKWEMIDDHDDEDVRVFFLCLSQRGRDDCRAETS